MYRTTAIHSLYNNLCMLQQNTEQRW